MMIFGGSPHMVAEPPRLAQNTSVRIMGIGSKCNRRDSSMVTAARKRMTVMLSMNMASREDMIMKAMKMGMVR